MGGKKVEDPAKYDAWYSQKRGAWIGKTEYTLIRRNLPINLDDSVLDVGCGTRLKRLWLSATGQK